MQSNIFAQETEGRYCTAGYTEPIFAVHWPKTPGPSFPSRACKMQPLLGTGLLKSHTSAFCFNHNNNLFTPASNTPSSTVPAEDLCLIVCYTLACRHTGNLPDQWGTKLKPTINVRAPPPQAVLSMPLAKQTGNAEGKWEQSKWPGSRR